MHDRHVAARAELPPAVVARYADACNLFGEAPVVRHKVEVLHRHCAEVDRDPATIEVTQLSTVLVGDDRAGVASAVERLRPNRMSAARFAERVNAGTVEQHLGRFHQLGAAGVQTAIVSLPDVEEPEAIARFGQVIAALVMRFLPRIVPELPYAEIPPIEFEFPPREIRERTKYGPGGLTARLRDIRLSAHSSHRDLGRE